MFKDVVSRLWSGAWLTVRALALIPVYPLIMPTLLHDRDLVTWTRFTRVNSGGATHTIRHYVRVPRFVWVLLLVLWCVACGLIVGWL